MTDNARIVIIAGPNGAGKTTFARAFLPQEIALTRFINADLIAAGLSPFAPETAAVRAGRLMLEEMQTCTRRGESFASGRRNFEQHYRHAVDAWALYDNAGDEPDLIDWGETS